jgi:hypothetical protein
MQIPSKAYERFISFCRALRDLIPPHDPAVPAQTSPSLAFAAAVLALLLAILEVDLHRAELHSIGLLSGDTDSVEPIFVGP